MGNTVKKAVPIQLLAWPAFLAPGRSTGTLLGSPSSLLTQGLLRPLGPPLQHRKRAPAFPLQTRRWGQAWGPVLRLPGLSFCLDFHTLG